jgi:hypothetical protein
MRPDKFGVLPMDFSCPWMRNLGNPEVNALDLTAEKSCVIQLTINAGITSPAVAGVSSWDYNWTLVRGSDSKIYRAPQPLMLRAYPGIALAAGQNDITNLPNSHPIDAVFILGSVPGNIYRLDLLNGSTRQLEVFSADAASVYGDYVDGFGDTFTAPVAGGGFGQTTSTTNQQSQHTMLADSPWLAADGIFPWDIAYLAAPDGRVKKSLNIAGTFDVRIYSSVAQTARLLLASFPGKFSAT